MRSLYAVIMICFIIGGAIAGLLIFQVFLHETSRNISTYNGITETPFKHIVIFILENHAFDNVFGTYPFGYPLIKNGITCSVSRPVGLFNQTLPNDLNLEQAKSVILKDPIEGYLPYHKDWNLGLMNGFAEYSGAQSQVFLSYQQVPLLWDYAEEYTLADDYFSPVLSVTQANRLAYLTGYPTGVENDSNLNSAINISDTVMYQLSENNISWTYFVLNRESGVIPFPLNSISGIRPYSDHIVDTSRFFYDILNHELPSVSWISFTGGKGYDCHSINYDMHPPGNLTLAQINLYKYINAIMKSNYWNDTLILITFDEGGGFFDQVPPPIIFTYGLGKSPYLSSLNLSNYSTLGQRIPLILISAYSREGWVNNYTLSGYSILGFIDYNWHMRFITNIVANSDVAGFLNSFNFSKPRPPIILSYQNWTYPLPLQYPIHYGFIATIDNNYTEYFVLYERGFVTATALKYIEHY
ncbi:hypothetical protein HS7_15260 [Sulfolobales archaeon HS-7]|nr:hypothetical protein HS7_15260 [Sulfolobales archaeon HS-7]